MSEILKDLYAQSQERLVTSYDENDSLRSEIAGHCDEMNLLRGALKDYQEEVFTPSDLATLAEPMGLALVPIEHTQEVIAEMVTSRTKFRAASYAVQASQLYKTAIRYGRITPKQAEKGKDDALRS